MSPEDLPPVECFPTDTAGVAIVGAADDRLETPNILSTSGEAAEAMAGVKTLMVAEIFGHGPTIVVVSAVNFGSDTLTLYL